ncbi:hypothetical protein CH293_05660 [Rhodococcus sp. 14-2470-1b]|nr:hypothetical protein CH293_05660 [Rhodococcus sp. 14-2470-1b]
MRRDYGGIELAQGSLITATLAVRRAVLLCNEAVQGTVLLRSPQSVPLARVSLRWRPADRSAAEVGIHLSYLRRGDLPCDHDRTVH